MLISTALSEHPNYTTLPCATPQVAMFLQSPLNTIKFSSGVLIHVDTDINYTIRIAWMCIGEGGTPLVDTVSV